MLLVATGLKREADILAGDGVRVIAGGGDSARLERELEAAAGEAAAVLSMGLCGALAEGLKPGDWVVGDRVISEETACDAAWASALAKQLNARLGPVFASDAMIVDAAGKRELHATTGAVAADMESHVAAEVAARHGLPFAIARTVSDAADRSLPIAAQAGMAADGGMDIGAVLLALARRPWQLPALIRVGAEAGAAFKALRDGRDLLGPGLGRPDFSQLGLDVV